MIKKLRIKLTVAFTLAALLFSFSESKASHSMGADLTYECLGGNNYKLRLSFYRDCIGIAAPTSVTIDISSATCGLSLTKTLQPIPGTGQEVTPLCPSAVSTCNGGVFTGIQEWIYEGVVTLPAQCTDWFMSYNLCCRNAAINTITTPGASTFFIYATLNNTVSPCNSSPTFSNKPVPFICMGQEFCFNHGAYDADGDSLVYSLITPMQDAVTNVNYIAPYSASNPLNSVPAMQFNTATGDMCMTPQALQVTVMAVLVSEYRNGVLIGTVERDIQITVINCNNNLPTLSGINGTNVFTATICANQPYCFNIFSNDVDAGQNLFVSWDQSIPGATFNTAGSPHPTGTFCWTPTDADISSTPHCFTAMVHDDACPMFGSQIYSYCITVIGIDVNAGPDQYITCNDLATISATASGGTPPYTYLWSNGFTNPTQTVGVGTYVVTVSDGTCSSTDTVSVYHISEPTAAFTAASLCINNPVQFTDQSTVTGSTIVSWQWYFGDGSSSTTHNPSHQYANDGTYNVTLIVTTNLGCVDTITQPVTIYPIPVASFTVSASCAGNAATITNTSTPAGAISGWSWNFGNGTSSNQQNPTVVYPDSGTYTITLIAGDTLGCSDTVAQQITIAPAPVAAFTFTGLSACQGGSVSFNDNSSGNIISWNWNFGNGQTSTQQNPSTIFNTTGQFDVTLIVASANGCIDSITQTISISPPPVASAGVNQAVCQGSTATLTATGGVTYQWSTGQTGSTIQVNPTTATTYAVTVTDANGCTDQAQVTVTINPLPVVVVSPDQNICAGQSATITASGGVTYNWTPTGDVTASITVSPNASTTYSVTATNANGCSATAFVNVMVHPNPVLNIPSTFVCAGASATLNAGNAGSTYQWSTGATTPTINVTTAGTYTVTVTNSFGCSATQAVQVTQGGTISNNNTNVAFCQGGSAVLDAGNPGNTYQWSTGATSQTITVNAGGQYAVTITNALGCSATITTTVNVNALPVPQFTPHDVCINETVNFVDVSTVTNGTIAAWQWDFGDGNVSQQQNPVHTYTTAGAYNITLVVTSSAGCTASLVQSVSVWALPVPDFTFNNACTGTSVLFTNASVVSSGTISSYQWNFGDGTTATTQNPSHQYTLPGVYNVTLAIASNGGCVDSITHQVAVYALPVADFSSTTVCKGTATDFTDLSSVSGNNINYWHWDFGDATTSLQQNPSHTYSTSGNFTAQLIIQTAYGCSDTVSFPVNVLGLPTANAGADQTVCTGTSVTLSASGGLGYAWQPTGDTTASIQVSPPVTTTYTVVVTDVNGCTNSDSVRVSIKSLPNVNAGPDKSVCAGTSVSLVASGGGSYLWSPGGQTTQSISVSPTTTGNYTVVVTGANGCSATDSVKVTVNALPIAVAGPDQNICNGITTTLSASGGMSYNWLTTGDTTATIYVNPTANTNYIVQVTDVNGCQATDTIAVTVNPNPVVNLGNAFICTGSNTTLDAGNAGNLFSWTPNGETTQTILVSTAGTYGVTVTNANGCTGYAQAVVVVGGDSIIDNTTNLMACDGVLTTLDAGNPGATYAWSTGATTQTISVNTAGTYTVTITDPGGCTAVFASNVIFNPLPVVGFISQPSCLNAPIVFTNQTSISSGNIISYSWDFGDGTMSTAQNPSHQYAQTGNYNVTLQATSGNGCSSAVTLPVNINTVPQINFGSTTACYGDATQFTDLSTINPGSITNWNWNFGDGDTSTLQNPSHVYSVPGTYDVTLIGSSAFGCADSITLNITVHPRPQAAFAFTNVCFGEANDFTDASFIVNGVIDVYNWNFGDGTTSSQQNDTHTYAVAGTYNVTLSVISDMGCADTISFPVLVYPKPVAQFTPQNVCQYNAAVLNNLSSVSSGSITNSYWNFGDNTSSNDSVPSHLFAQAGTYPVSLIVTTDNGCIDTVVSNVVVYDVPQAQFYSQNVCQNSYLQFNDSSIIANGTINNWFWNFGNGITTTQQNPSQNFTVSGTLNISLIVTSDNGCVDTVTQGINVYPLPVADFTTADVCLGDPMTFTNQASVSGGGVFTCSWDFGDGDTSSIENPSHTYLNAGNFNVVLTATTNTGCISTTMHTVTVNDAPDARFSANNVCQNEITTFNDLSTAPNGIIVAWNWTFGDGTSSQSKNPVHVYNGAGVYPVRLTVTSNFGCDDFYDDTVRVYRLPEPQISVSAECAGSTISMIDASDTSLTGTIDWQWQFGDGNTGIGYNPTHIYTNAGTYTVVLSVTNANGCRSTDTTTVEVHPLPVADFTGGPGCEGSAIDFTNTSTISSGTITGYQWNFGDSTATSNATNPSHVFTTAGTYNVTLIATSDFGCVDSTTYQVVIHPTPVSHFNFDQAAGCGPLTINFTDSSYVSMGNVVSWNWQFGDGGSDTTQNPSHTYYASGVYNVSLTVTSDMGCENTDTIPNAITIYPTPVAAFTPEPRETNILNPVIHFDNQSEGATIYSWNFGDGHHGNDFEPTHAYGDTGWYHVELFVVNQYGCTDSASDNVHIIPIWTLYVPNAFTPNNDGDNEIFDIKGIGIIDYTLSIWDRWGELIYQGDNHGWNGSVKGSDVMAKKDVYVFTVHATDVFGAKHDKTGTVTLIR